ncbi:MAG: LPS-assembly protein LptD [Rubrivivax sp.]|nr:LPS-assembly protein LptD [Rubrivivax sp.]
MKCAPCVPRLLALAAAGLMACPPGWSQGPGRAPAPPARPASAPAPIELQARELHARPDLDAQALGDVKLQRGPLLLQADWLNWDQAQDRVHARGHVRIDHPSGQYSGTELDLQLDRYFGFFLLPRYEFTRVQAGGRGQRIDFLGRERSVIEGGWYTSCPREDVVSPTGEGGTPRPDWVLQSKRVQLDFEANEGIAEGAVLRFMNVPILALPTLSFPIGEGRKSGWLPPTLDFDTRSGLSVAVPYYWNIAPNRDATLTPRIVTRRGLAADGEFRYLEPGYAGRIALGVLPRDRVADRSRWSLQAQHEGQLPLDGRWNLDALRVSDDAWWKDFPTDSRSLTPRLLSQQVGVERDLELGGGRGLAYARLQRWQVLQGSDQVVTAPYERAPQLGLQMAGRLAAPVTAVDYTLQSEASRFVLPDNTPAAAAPTGWRGHVLGSLWHRFGDSGAWLQPRLSVNAAAYALDQPLSDGRRHAQRIIPTASLEGGLVLERETALLGRKLRQTLEPRALYVNTPWRAQDALPNFDSAGRNIDFESIFSENAFSGVDRVSDSHQLTLGLTSRLFDSASGAEVGRLGVAQRFLLRAQRITPEGQPYARGGSDLFLLGGVSPHPQLALDASAQYSPELGRTMRAVASARWNPGEFRTLSATYRLTRNLAEQVELGWQWPVWKSAMVPAASVDARRSASSCGGTWYSVGRVNYSLRDRRLTDSIVGVEYDAGCWIVRLVAERLSTGRTEATTHILLQLELVGLSRLGANPLKVLKDNIPGYRLLREEPAQPTPAPPRYD